MRVAPLTCLIATSLAAAPSVAATRGFTVPGFDRVRSNVPFDVSVHTGRKAGVVANGDKDAIDRLEIGVRGGELVISTKRGAFNWFSGWNGSRHLKIDVTVPMIRAATLNGPGNLDVDSIRGRDVALSVSGPGNLHVWSLDAARLDTDLTGPGNIEATGRAARAHIDANGPGNVRFARLATRDIEVMLNGPGDVDAMASGTARLTLNGPGDIKVSGHPRCTVEKHGPGDVRCD